MRLTHVALWTRDLDAAAAFWRRTFGAEVGGLYESRNRPGFRSPCLRKALCRRIGAACPRLNLCAFLAASGLPPEKAASSGCQVPLYRRNIITFSIRLIRTLPASASAGPNGWAWTTGSSRYSRRGRGKPVFTQTLP